MVMELIPKLAASLLEITLAGQGMGPSILTLAAFVSELEPYVEESLAQKVVTPQPATDVMSMASEAVEDEPSHPEITAFGKRSLLQLPSLKR